MCLRVAACEFLCCGPCRVMPVAIERGGVIAGIIVLIIAAAGAWSLFGASVHIFPLPRVPCQCCAMGL